MPDLTDLIARVEGAGGADRRLDAKIALTCLPQFAGWIEHPANNGNQWGELFPSREAFNEWLAGDSSIGAFGAPAFTASLDAAMTLVPDGWKVAHVGQSDDGKWWAELRRGHITSYSAVALSALKLTTPALALCAAALKARNHLKGKP